MVEFEKYKRTQVAELRPVTKEDINIFKNKGELRFVNNNDLVIVSISRSDKIDGSPKLGDMIARNSEDYNDQWLVAKEYFKKNFKKIK